MSVKEDNKESKPKLVIRVTRVTESSRGGITPGWVTSGTVTVVLIKGPVAPKI